MMFSERFLWIMHETWKVNDEKIHQLQRDLKAWDLAIKKMTKWLFQVGKLMELVVSNVYTMEN